MSERLGVRQSYSRAGFSRLTCSRPSSQSKKVREKIRNAARNGVGINYTTPAQLGDARPSVVSRKNGKQMKIARAKITSIIQIIEKPTRTKQEQQIADIYVSEQMAVLRRRIVAQTSGD